MTRIMKQSRCKSMLKHVFPCLQNVLRFAAIPTNGKVLSKVWSYYQEGLLPSPYFTNLTKRWNPQETIFRCPDQKTLPNISWSVSTGL